MSKVENKPNLRQFVVVRSYYKDLLLKDEHIFTSDSLEEAIKIAHESLDNEYYIQVKVYEADGETLVTRFYPTDINALYKIRQYLK